MTDLNQRIDKYAAQLASKHTIDELRSELAYQTQPGIHTYTYCDCCDAGPSRGGRCCKVCLERAIEMKEDK